VEVRFVSKEILLKNKRGTWGLVQRATLEHITHRTAEHASTETKRVSALEVSSRVNEETGGHSNGRYMACLTGDT
jgi:hypothetical protein